MSLKGKKDTYEITISSAKDPNEWTSFEVSADDLLVKIGETLLNTNLRLEAVALVASNRKNRHDIPT